jgi:hypothetical protein
MSELKILNLKKKKKKEKNIIVEYREMGRAEMIAASAYSPWRVSFYPTV